MEFSLMPSVNVTNPGRINTRLPILLWGIGAWAEAASLLVVLELSREAGS